MRDVHLPSLRRLYRWPEPLQWVVLLAAATVSWGLAFAVSFVVWYW